MSDTPETKLLQKIEELRKDVAHYQDALHTANERISRATSAASSAAASTVTAIERIQEMEKVVEAAVNWHHGGQHHKLTEAVRSWLNYRKSWS